LNTNQKLSLAISAVLSGYAGASWAGPAAATDTDTTSASGIEEIVVTAQRRNESIQNVPITIQALSGAQLGQLNVTTFDDVLSICRT
jgi:iron complex outermembrane receptor protein